MSRRGDSSEYVREYRERRGPDSYRSSGEYFSFRYVENPHSRRAPPSSSYDTYDTYYGSSRGDRYDVPPTPRGHSGGRQSPFDSPVYDYDSHASHASHDTDHLRERFSKTRRAGSYTRRSPSPPPMRRSAVYEPDFDDLRPSGTSRGAPRWVAAMRIEEADENDPRVDRKPKAPYVYAGTTDPDETVVDEPKKSRASSRCRGDSGAHRSSGSYSRGASDEEYGGARHSGSYSGRSSGDKYGGSGYSRTSAGGARGTSPSYGGSAYEGATRHGYSRGSSYERDPYVEYL